MAPVDSLAFTLIKQNLLQLYICSVYLNNCLSQYTALLKLHFQFFLQQERRCVLPK